MRGAVLRGLNDDIIRRSQSRRDYGIFMKERYDPYRHEHIPQDGQHVFFKTDAETGLSYMYGMMKWTIARVSLNAGQNVPPSSSVTRGRSCYQTQTSIYPPTKRSVKIAEKTRCSLCICTLAERSRLRLRTISQVSRSPKECPGNENLTCAQKSSLWEKRSLTLVRT